MRVHQYKSYEEYKAEQNKAFRRKLHISGVGLPVIEEIKSRIPNAKNILCHGTRSGSEQGFFKMLYPEAEVMGTEIGERCEVFPMTTQWDFHDVKEEWVGKYDIVYTNAFDHAMRPEEALKTWVDQLASGGSLVIEFHITEGNNEIDCNQNIDLGETTEYIESLGTKVLSEWKSPKFGYELHPRHIEKDRPYIAGFGRTTKQFVKE